MIKRFYQFINESINIDKSEFEDILNIARDEGIETSYTILLSTNTGSFNFAWLKTCVFYVPSYKC